jgi:hypothetical protein
MRIIFEDYCAVHSLEFTLKVCQLHMELALSTARYPSISSSSDFMAQSNNFDNRVVERQAIEYVSEFQETPTSENLDVLLRLWRFNDNLDIQQQQTIRRALNIEVVRLMHMGSRRRVLHERSKVHPSTLMRAHGVKNALDQDFTPSMQSNLRLESITDTRECKAFYSVASGLKKKMTYLIVEHEKQRKSDQCIVLNRPRIGAHSAIRRLMELEIERSLRWNAQQSQVVHDLLNIVRKQRDSLKGRKCETKESIASTSSTLQDREETSLSGGLNESDLFSIPSSPTIHQKTCEITLESEYVLQTFTPDILTVEKITV